MENNDQEYYNELMRECYEAEEKHEQEVDNKNQSVIKTIALSIELIEFPSFKYNC